jgi:hypothetical protein
LYISWCNYMLELFSPVNWLLFALCKQVLSVTLHPFIV